MEIIKKAVLRKMLASQIIGGRHTAIENISKGFPKHLRWDVEKAVKQLIKEGYIILKPTSYGLQVSLNPTRIKEIREMVEA
ncbi:MAG: hypothetical protein ACUVTD_09205 [Nitrososphaerales archaeon]